MVTRRFTVGIFTREHEDLYQWLITLLLSFSVVKDVRHVLISNNFYDFRQEAGKCDFAILYHSKKRGRLNVTDVTDSLYDMELKHLNETHGKDKVLVVIDDLEDSGDHVKSDILNSQNSINQLAKDLFIFSTADKAHLGDNVANGYQNEPDLRNKLSSMKTIIEASSGFLGGAWFGTGGGSPGTDPESGRSTARPLRRCSPICIFIIFIIVVALILVIAIPLSIHH